MDTSTKNLTARPQSEAEKMLRQFSISFSQSADEDSCWFEALVSSSHLYNFH